MISDELPAGFRVETLARIHARKAFRSGVAEVDDWLRTKAMQNQEKRLSVTRVLIDDSEAVAGYYTLASGQIDFSELPADITKGLPKRLLPVAILAWLGITSDRQRQGLGRLLLSRALRECSDASRTFPFVAVILDCIDDRAKAFYQQWDFRELTGHTYRLFLGASHLESIIQASD